MTQSLTNAIQDIDDGADLRAELRDRAAALVPALRASDSQAEQDRRLSEETVQSLHDAGLFRLCSPREFGGFEGDVRTYLDPIVEVGRGSGSAAWVAFISNTGAWIAGYFPDKARREIFDGNPDARFIGVLAPTATTRRVDGGYRITGRWGYASGSLHAHWGLFATPLEQEDGTQVPGVVLAPMSETTVEDTWYSAGVRGSGSNTVVAEDLFIPEHRAMPLADLMRDNALGDPNRDVAHRQAFAATAVIAVAAPVLGLAQAALDLTVERINQGGKRIAYSTYTDTREAPAMQIQIAEASSLISVARTSIEAWCDRIAGSASRLEELSVADRTQMRVDLGTAMRLSRDAVDLLLSVQGASAFMEANPIQRVWRDLETATRHGLLTPEVPLEIQGRSLFGEVPELSPFV